MEKSKLKKKNNTIKINQLTLNTKKKLKLVYPGADVITY